jgi:hypothetical protein
MTNPNPLNPMRLDKVVRDLTDDSMMMMNTLSQKMNAVSFERAIQKGYAMACEDHGKPIPVFVDPMKELLG